MPTQTADEALLVLSIPMVLVDQSYTINLPGILVHEHLENRLLHGRHVLGVRSRHLYDSGEPRLAGHLLILDPPLFDYKDLGAFRHRNN